MPRSLTTPLGPASKQFTHVTSSLNVVGQQVSNEGVRGVVLEDLGRSPNLLCGSDYVFQEPKPSAASDQTLRFLCGQVKLLNQRLAFVENETANWMLGTLEGSYATIPVDHAAINNLTLIASEVHNVVSSLPGVISEAMRGHPMQEPLHKIGLVNHYRRTESGTDKRESWPFLRNDSPWDNLTQAQIECEADYLFDSQLEPNKTLIDYGSGWTLSRAQIQTLKSEEWVISPLIIVHVLPCNVLDCACYLALEKANKRHGHKVHWFIPTLFAENWPDDRIIRAIFTEDKFFIGPASDVKTISVVVNDLRQHWLVFTVDMDHQRVLIFDSRHSTYPAETHHTDIIKNLVERLERVLVKLEIGNFVVWGWQDAFTYNTVEEMQQQDNTNDCGVYSLMLLLFPNECMTWPHEVDIDMYRRKLAVKLFNTPINRAPRGRKMCSY